MTLNPSCDSGSIRFACLRYSVTTREPGARLVLTYGLTFKPFSRAFLASNPAPTITDGFDVLVQDVIAAMTTAPCFIFISLPLARPADATVDELKVDSAFTASGLSSKPRSFTGAVRALLKVSFNADIATRSWGRLGPAKEGTTEARSS